jgi:protein phosphatase PTC2/3
VLAVSRAFGDVQFKEVGKAMGPVISIPDVHSEVITPMTEFAIVATDGLWDIVNPQEAVNLVRKRLSTKTSDLQDCARELAQEAIRRGSVDNVTVLIMSFHMPPP